MTAPGARRALVTGANGFVGVRLARLLADSGWDVTAVVRARSDPSRLRAAAPAARVHVHHGGLEDLTALAADVRPDVTFHLASVFVAEHRPEDVGPLVDGNVRFGTEVAEALVAAGSRHLVTASTFWEHYEDRDYDPVCLYAATKRAFEDILRYYHEARGLSVSVLTFFDTYGPGDPRKKLFWALARAARTGERLAMSPGEQRLDLVYVDDAARALLAAARWLLEQPGPRMTRFSASSGRHVTLRDVVATYAALSGRPLAIEWGGRPYRAREVMRPWSRGVPVVGWRPEVPLEEGLRRLIAAERDESGENAH